MINRWFNVGKIVNIYGIKGEVWVIFKMDFVEEWYKFGNMFYLFVEGVVEFVKVMVNIYRFYK